MKYIALLFFISKSAATTLCGTIVHSVATVAFGNYLSASTGLLLTFFRNPDKDDKTFSAQLRRYIIFTATVQLLSVLCLMTYMTTRFFQLNSETLPDLLRKDSVFMYSICAASSLTTFVKIIYVTSHSKNYLEDFFDPYSKKNVAPALNSYALNRPMIPQENEKHTHLEMLANPLTIIQIIFYIMIYFGQMVFQIYMRIKFPAPGYMNTFQIISILSMLSAIPLFLIVKHCTRSQKFLYVFIYPFVFQIYLHAGYISFYLYCDEGYLSSTLLFVSNFALSNVLR
ncbi:6396_t:CDS:1, partial [Cetraspora pellucida]